MSDSIRTVLLGYGLAGESFHGPLLANTPGIEVVGILTSNPERQQRAQRDFPSAQVFSDVSAALNTPSELAVVAGANVTHVPYAVQALESGKHVVIDKPVAPTAADVQNLADRAHAAQRHVIAFQNRRWDSDFLTMLDIRDSGRIGEIHRFESKFGKFAPQPKGAWRESVDPADMGGVLYDLGSHLIDQALVLMGPVESVTAFARSIRDADIADDDAVIILRHMSGALSYLVGSVATAYPHPRMLALGREGSARIEVMDSQEIVLRTGGSPADQGFGQESHELFISTQASGFSEVTESLIPGDWLAFYAGVRDAVRGEADSPVPIAQTVEAARVIDAALTSAREGRTVSLDE